MKGTKHAQVLRLEVGEQYLQVLLSHYKEARSGLESLGASKLTRETQHALHARQIIILHYAYLVYNTRMAITPNTTGFCRFHVRMLTI